MPRQRGGQRIISRMYSVSPADSEKFHLRLLLLHVLGATSYDDLKTVSGSLCSNFREACIQRHLLSDDGEYNEALMEALSDAPTASYHVCHHIVPEIYALKKLRIKHVITSTISSRKMAQAVLLLAFLHHKGSLVVVMMTRPLFLDLHPTLMTSQMNRGNW